MHGILSRCEISTKCFSIGRYIPLPALKLVQVRALIVVYACDTDEARARVRVREREEAFFFFFFVQCHTRDVTGDNEKVCKN